MFNEFVILHTPPKIEPPLNDKNTLSVEKMTQTGEGIWQVSIIVLLHTYKSFREHPQRHMSE